MRSVSVALLVRVVSSFSSKGALHLNVKIHGMSVSPLVGTG